MGSLADNQISPGLHLNAEKTENEERAFLRGVVQGRIDLEEGREMNCVVRKQHEASVWARNLSISDIWRGCWSFNGYANKNKGTIT